MGHVHHEVPLAPCVERSWVGNLCPPSGDLTRLADFSPTPVTQWRCSQIWVKKDPVLEAAWLETPDSIRKSINPVLFLPRAFHYFILLRPHLRAFTSLFKPHKDNPKATREKEKDPHICERHWSFFYTGRSQHRQVRCCCCSKRTSISLYSGLWARACHQHRDPLSSLESTEALPKG